MYRLFRFLIGKQIVESVFTWCKDTKKKIKESSRSGNSYTIITNNLKKLSNEDC